MEESTWAFSLTNNRYGFIKVDSQSHVINLVCVDRITGHSECYPLWQVLYNEPPQEHQPIENYNEKISDMDNFVWLTYFNKLRLDALFLEKIVACVIDVIRYNIIATIKDYILYCKQKHPQWRNLSVNETVEKFYTEHAYDVVALGIYDEYLKNFIQKGEWSKMPNCCRSSDPHTIGRWITDSNGCYYIQRIHAQKTNGSNDLVPFVSVFWNTTEKPVFSNTMHEQARYLFCGRNTNRFFDNTVIPMIIPYHIVARMFRDYLISLPDISQIKNKMWKRNNAYDYIAFMALAMHWKDYISRECSIMLII